MLVWLAFTLFLVVPLYVLTVVVAARSAVFSSGPLTDNQFKSLWTFIASGLATSATVLAALLTKAHNDRVTAVQRLETVVRSLESMAHDGKYAPRAVLAGALSTLIELGHPPVASRVLAAALDDEAVDKDVAAWLLNSLLTSGDEALSEDAAGTLSEHADEFTGKDSAYFAWPASMTAAWPVGLSANAALNAMTGLVDLLLSRAREWWGDDWLWIPYTLDQAVIRDPRVISKGNAARLILILADITRFEFAQGVNETYPRDEIIDRANKWRDRGGNDFTEEAERIRAWANGGGPSRSHRHSV